MTIRWKCKSKQGCYVENQLPDWAMLDGCFSPTRVTPSDVDGIIHQNGKHLFLEKKFPNAYLDGPQLRSIDSHVYNGNSYIVIWCTKPDGSDISLMRVWGIAGYPLDRRINATLADFRTAVSRWWQANYRGTKDELRRA